jgi:hypothetical protein
MARDASVTVNAINLAFEAPARRNKVESYRELIESLYGLDIQPRVHGETHMTISFVANYQERKDTMYGYLARFTNIDEYRWFNAEQRRAATPEERANILVPPQMRANYTELPFLFDLKLHRVVFVVRAGQHALSIGNVASMFTQLTNARGIREEYGKIAVSVEQAPEAVSEMLRDPTLRELEILIRRPNDTFGDLEEHVMKDLEGVSAAEAEVIVRADDSHRLRPNAQIRRLARVAGSNGYVKAKVIRQGRLRQVSSENYPIAATQVYSPKRLHLFGAFILDKLN